VVHCFAAIVDSSMRIEEGGGLADEHEDIEIVTLTLDEAMAMVTSGEISDAKTIIMLQWAAMNRSVFGADVENECNPNSAPGLADRA